MVLQRVANMNGVNGKIFFVMICESIFAFILILLLLPLLLLISLILFIQNGRPIFYKGARLGLKKEQFKIYKFRTLKNEAEKVIGARLLSETHMMRMSRKLITPFGQFLRDTRLDELPQLFNILNGKMSFIGPRPERPLIYKINCQKIRGYDKRFIVRPGLIGYSQLFTPHCTSKRMRALLDNHFITQKKNLAFKSMLLVPYTALLVIWKSISKTGRYVGWKIKKKMTFNHATMNGCESTLLLNGKIVGPFSKNKPSLREFNLYHINAETFRFSTDHPLNKGGSQIFKLCMGIRYKTTGDYRIKTAICEGRFHQKTKNSHGYLYEFKYRPTSPLNEYKIHQYFLGNSIANTRYTASNPDKNLLSEIKTKPMENVFKQARVSAGAS